MQNKLQTTLTLLGFSVGVAMVVIVSGLGLGAQDRIEQQIEGAGPTMIVVRPGNYQPAAIANDISQDSSGGEPSEGSYSFGFGNDGLGDPALDAVAMDARKRTREAVVQRRHRSPAAPLTAADLAALRAKVADVRAIAGSAEGNVTLDESAGVGARIVRVGGIERAWPEMRGWKLINGRLMSESEHASGAAVMVMTPAVARKLWPDAASALGQTMTISGQPVELVGLVDGTKDDPTAIIPRIHVPLRLAQTLLGRDRLDSITVRTRSVAVTTQVAEAIRAELRGLHALPDDMLDDFRVQTQSVAALPSLGSDPRTARSVHGNVVSLEAESWEEMAKSLRAAGRTFTLLLAAAAAVSLLVGGIGVMNIMLVSVSARTREIGLRMAMGARTKDVLVQFLVEAVTLAALGGLLGLMLGVGGLLIADKGFHWATAVSPTMLLLAVLMAAVTGVTFGFGPARAAAALDPVVALRAE